MFENIIYRRFLWLLSDKKVMRSFTDKPEQFFGAEKRYTYLYKYNPNTNT